MDWLGVGLGVVAGLALFLYGVGRLAHGLRTVAGDRMRALLERATRNRVMAVGAGTLATAVLDSSSVTIILVIALVDAGAISATRALGVILGANIGTTISSQVIALDVERYAPLVLALGLALAALGRRDTWREVGTALFGMGLVFFGLGQIGGAVEPLRESGSFAEWMTRLESPLAGASVGALATVVIQSSSATLGIAITLASQGLLALPAGVAVMLGAEIGTCADTLAATIGRSREALRAGIFHLAFNIATVTLGLFLVEPLTAIARGLGGDTARQVANAHVAFNVAGVLLVLPFLGPIAAGLRRFVPDAAPSGSGTRVRAGRPQLGGATAIDAAAPDA